MHSLDVPGLASAPTPAQQKVLDRIAKQRNRLKARSAAQRQALSVQAAQQEVVEPDSSSLVVRLLAFARMHPAAVAVAAAVVVAAGPARLIRWSALLLPLWSRMRR